MRRRHGTGLTRNEQKVLAAALWLAYEGVVQLYGYELFRTLTVWEGDAPMNHGRSGHGAARRARPAPALDRPLSGPPGRGRGVTVALFDRLEVLFRHRLPSDERRTYDSFRADIDAHWHPDAPTERRLERRSRLVHLATASGAGGVTLAGVGVSGPVTLVGTVMLLVAPLPPTDWYDQPTPVWIETLLAVGILAMAVECARFPHVVRRVGFTATTVPLAVGALGAGLTMPVALAPDVALRAALLVAGVGACVSGVGALGQHDGATRVGHLRRRPRPLARHGVRVQRHRRPADANGLLFARPSLVRRP